MGWNTAALYLRDATADEAVAALAGADATADWVSADEATSGAHDGVLFAATAGGWAQAWDPSGRFVFDCAPDAAALTVCFSSVASTYGFTLFGDDGGVARDFLVSEGETVRDEGEPLPAETRIELPSWGPDEDFVWAVIEAVTGTGYDERLRFRVYRVRG